MDDVAYMSLRHYENVIEKMTRDVQKIEEQERKLRRIWDYILSECKRQTEEYGDAPVYLDPAPIMKELGADITEKQKKEWLLKYQESHEKSGENPSDSTE